MPHRARKVEVRNLGGSAEVLRLAARTLGRRKIPRSTLALWRRSTTRPPFPRPAKKLKMGDVWDLTEVQAWLEQSHTTGDSRRRVD